MYRLFYRSLAVRHLEDSELNGLVRTCQRHNDANLITGLLAFDGTHFHELLEGRREDVIRTMDRIKQDPRHRHIRILGQKPVSERAYLSWGYRTDRGQVFTELEDAMRFDGVAHD